MSNSFYNHGSFPSTGSSATSASMRAELDLVGAAFDKMPTLSGGNANMFVLVNSAGTALTASSTLPALTVNDTYFVVQDDADNTRKFRFEATGITSGTTRILTIPDANTTLVGIGVTQTLTNKTLTSPTISGGTINNMSVGATTASTGAFTTLSASSTVSGIGFSAYLASPPAIGGTAAAAGAFTTLSASSTTTLSGNQIISVTDNTNAALRITQLGTGNALLVEDSTNPDSTPFVIDASGKVAIGSTTATENLNITADGRNFLQMTRASTDISQSVFSFRKSRGTNAAPTVVTFGDVIGEFQFYGYDGTQFLQAAGIRSTIDGTPGTNDMPGNLAFNTTADGASSSTERMRIDSAGAVGIGTTSLTGYGLRVGKNLTGSTAPVGIASTGTVQSDATSNAQGFRTSIGTQATAFTLPTLYHYTANQAALGATSAVTTQIGFYADSTLVDATNNYGFFSNLASGTGRFNFYANGTAANFFGGTTVVSVTDNTNAALRITQLGTGNALLVEDSANPDSTPFVIDASGNVIVGTTASITNGVIATAPVFQEHGLTNNLSSIGLTNWSSTAARTSSVNFNRSAGNVVGTRAGITTAGTAIGTLSFSGDDGTNWLEAAKIEGLLDTTGGTNDMPGRLVFSTTADGASSPTEAMRINSAQNVSIGTSAASAGTTLRLSKSITGAVASYGILNNGTIQSDVTSQANIFTSNANTVASAFTLANLRHFYVNQGTVGSTSAITNQYGFFAESGMTGATNNYGFYGDVASGTGRYNFYANGTADNYFAGSLGMGSVPITTAKLYITNTITDTANSESAVYSIMTANNASGSNIKIGNRSSVLTGASFAGTGILNAYRADLTYSLASAYSNSLQGFRTSISNSGAGAVSGVVSFSSTNPANTGGGLITNFYGFSQDDVTTATNVYGFLGTVTSGASKFNLYMSGTANNYLAGRLGIGSTGLTDALVPCAINPTGATNMYGFRQFGTIQSDVTASYSVYQSSVSTQATAFTLTTLRHFQAAQSTIGAGSAVTTQHGFIAEGSLVGATNNYGFYGNIASGTGRWNFYAAGTADNYFAGNVGIGTNSPSTYGKFAVVGSGFNGGNANFVSTSSGNSITVTGVNGAGVNDVAYYNFTDGTNNAFIGLTGTNATAGALRFATGASPTERMRIDSSGNVLVTNVAGLGYGTGSGGTVTQATSKSTGVTLNKPTGQITLNNAALAANTVVSFTLTNSLIAASDVVSFSFNPSSPSVQAYNIWSVIGSGNTTIYLKNISAGSLSDAVVINFVVIKGAAT